MSEFTDTGIHVNADSPIKHTVGHAGGTHAVLHVGTPITSGVAIFSRDPAWLRRLAAEVLAAAGELEDATELVSA